MRVLITGAAGFMGRYLAKALHLAGHEVHGLVHQMPATPVEGAHSLHVANLAFKTQVYEVVRQLQPHKVAHLAAIAFVAHGDAEEIYRTNLMGTRNLMEVLVQVNAPLDAVLLASSANVYGNAVEGVLNEDTPPAPTNDYAVSKLAMEFLARLYAGRLPLMVARPFNCTGVGQAESFLIPKIVNHIRRRAPFIELGNLQVARDFSDVRSVVQYYRLLLESPAAVGQTFNVCSGLAYTLDEVLTLAQSLAGHALDVRVNPAFVRSNEVKKLIGSRAKLDAAVGPVPAIALADTLRWMLEEPL